jgi:hypothetical protein
MWTAAPPTHVHRVRLVRLVHCKYGLIAESLLGSCGEAMVTSSTPRMILFIASVHFNPFGVFGSNDGMEEFRWKSLGFCLILIDAGVG